VFIKQVLNFSRRICSVKSNQKDTLKSTKEWYNFLNNADKKLVFPVIA